MTRGLTDDATQQGDPLVAPALDFDAMARWPLGGEGDAGAGERGEVGRASVWRLLRAARALEPGRRPGVAYQMAFVALFALIRATIWALQGLDALLYPRLRDQPVEEPLFIIANPRSGTTFLHGLLALDEERFTHHRFYQTVIPSVLTYRAGALAERLDRRLGGRLGGLMGWADRTFLSFWDGIHPMSFGKAEEDEALFVYQRASLSVCLLLPVFEALRPVELLDRLPPDERRAVMGFYRKCLQGHLFAVGGGRRFLGKNVLDSGRVHALREAFPDARFVHLIRHPYEAIPSFISMFSAPWRHHTPTIAERSPECRQLARIAVTLYRHLYESRAALPADDFIDIRYTDLIADPKATVLGIYEAFDLTPGPDFLKALDEATSSARAFRSVHTYSLEQYGLTRQEIHAALSDIFDAYGFDPAGADLG